MYTNNGRVSQHASQAITIVSTDGAEPDECTGVAYGMMIKAVGHQIVQQVIKQMMPRFI